jgi:fructokinase
MQKTIDIICAGEVLIDCIGHEINSLQNTQNFHRFLGGSPTNVAFNATRLGLKVVLVATTGKDGLGEFILEKLQSNKVNTDYVRKSDDLPTSVIFVSRSKETPEFIAYRQADVAILETQIPEELLAKSKIFHTTCFALSKNPAQTTIVESAKKAHRLGLQTSIDINFSEKIWPNREEAKQIIAQYLSTKPLVKISDDDCFRYFGEPKSDEFIFDYFHQLGASTICLTKGKDGVVLSDLKQGLFFQKAQEVKEIIDSTGAGDAFWTGFLFAYLKHKTFEECLTIAQKLAVIKLQHLGGLPESFSINSLLNL